MTVEKQVQATREGGAVQRCHVLRHGRPYDVAQHTFGAVNLLLLLHPNPTIQLVKAVQWHDVVEKWTGDLPAPALRNAGVAEAVERLRRDVLCRLGLYAGDSTSMLLTEEEREWVHAVDVLEFWLWCRENQQEPDVAIAFQSATLELADIHTQGHLPASAWAFYVGMLATPSVPLPFDVEKLGPLRWWQKDGELQKRR